MIHLYHMINLYVNLQYKAVYLLIPHTSMLYDDNLSTITTLQAFIATDFAHELM